jgi:hypothetical protein
MTRDTSQTKFTAICRQVSPAYHQYVCAVYGQTPLVHESGMIRTQMGTHNTSGMVAVLETPCVIPPRNSNGKVLQHYLCHFQF